MSRHIRDCGFAAVFVLTIACLLACAHSAEDSHVGRQVEEVISLIRAGDLSKASVLRRMGEEVLPELIDYADDHDPNVRYAVAMALGEIPDGRAVGVLIDRLNDPDFNVRRCAIDGLHGYPREILRSRQSAEMFEAFREYLGRWDQHSYKAALLISDLADTASMAALRGVLEEAEGIDSTSDPRTVMVPSMKSACLKALVGLGEAEAVDTARMLLRANDVTGIVLGIDCFVYSGKEEFIADVLSLLDDKRDAVNISPSGGEYYLRVRDLALNALMDLSEVQPSFVVQHGARYSDDQVGEVKGIFKK